MGIKSGTDSDRAPGEQPVADSLERGLRTLARMIALQHIKRIHRETEPDRAAMPNWSDETWER